jgi:hypothetical protein
MKNLVSTLTGGGVPMNRNSSVAAEIARLTEELKVLSKKEEEEKRELRETTKRVWKFTFLPSDKESLFYGPRPASEVQVFSLFGSVTNEEECLAAGYNKENLQGVMCYFVNMLNHEVVCHAGGGSIFITSSPWGSGQSVVEAKEDAEVAFKALGKFLASNSDGGDVTEIIMNQRHFSWR